MSAFQATRQPEWPVVAAMNLAALLVVVSGGWIAIEVILRQSHRGVGPGHRAGTREPGGSSIWPCVPAQFTPQPCRCIS